VRETFLAPAKLNLYLKVVGKRDDGYHLIESVMQSVSLFDSIDIELVEGEDSIISCDDVNIPCDQSNIAYKCADEVFKYIGFRKGIIIDIKKNIPYGAGLGGGSADGAAVICGLNRVLSLNLSLEEMCKIGEKVGADIPFMILGGTAKVTGIGENIEKISDIKDCFFIIIKPDVSISTKEAYKKIDDKVLDKNDNFDNILKSIESQNLVQISKYIENDFEMVAPNIIFEIKNNLKDKGALNSLMTGSGSAVFGIFENEYKAIFAKNELELIYDKVYLVRSVDKW